MGRVSPGKGFEEFLQAARLLRDRHPEMSLRFVVVGEASYGEEAYHDGIVRRARELGLGESVLFTGFRRDIPALLNAMDVFIFPSRAEGFGATVIEAMAMGVACVSTRSDGTLDTVEDGETGLVFQGGDAEGLARSVESLLNGRASARAPGGDRPLTGQGTLQSRRHDRSGWKRSMLPRLPLPPDLHPYPP